MRSIAGLLGGSCRGAGLVRSIAQRQWGELVRQNRPKSPKLVVDNTGLKLFGEEGWLEKKYKTKRKRRSWRKLHLGLDLVSGQIGCSDLTMDDVGDPIALPGLLDQFNGPLDLFLADGAYDGEPKCAILIARSGLMIKVTIPPPKNAVLSPDAAQSQSTRDCHIADIAARGSMAWQTSSGHNQRSRGETLMARWNAVIGPKLKAKSFENQKTEAKIGAQLLDRITELGRPNFERTA
jgi:hypothetical protein